MNNNSKLLAELAAYIAAGADMENAANELLEEKIKPMIENGKIKAEEMAEYVANLEKHKENGGAEAEKIDMILPIMTQLMEMAEEMEPIEGEPNASHA